MLVIIKYTTKDVRMNSYNDIYIYLYIYIFMLVNCVVKTVHNLDL